MPGVHADAEIALIAKGLLLGWSVAWPPGPINAAMLRRSLERGFFPAWALGLGACSGDFLWALGVALGAGAVVNLPGVHWVLGIVSICLLLLLARTFGRGAWVAWRQRRALRPAGSALPVGRFDTAHGGYLLGLTLALSSPWNIAFWLAVIGSQATERLGLGGSLTIAIAVCIAAAMWGAFLCGSVRLGARFATPAWHVVTQGATAALMLYFAIRSVVRLAGG